MRQKTIQNPESKDRGLPYPESKGVAIPTKEIPEIAILQIPKMGPPKIPFWEIQFCLRFSGFSAAGPPGDEFEIHNDPSWGWPYWEI